MTSLIRRAVATGTAALALGTGVALGTAGAAGAATAKHIPWGPGPVIPNCAVSQVHESLQYTGLNHRGIFYHIEFRNTKGRECAVSGTPKVEALDSHHRAIGNPARFASFPGKNARVLPARGTDHSTLEAVSPSYFKDSHPVQASYLRIWMPGDSHSETVRFSHPVTSRGPSNLYVGSVKTGY